MDHGDDVGAVKLNELGVVFYREDGAILAPVASLPHEGPARAKLFNMDGPILLLYRRVDVRDAQCKHFGPAVPQFGAVP